MKKTILFFILSTPFLAFSQVSQPDIKINVDPDAYKNGSLSNTPINTGGANYNAENPTGLDEYKLRKNELNKKIKIVSEEQAKIKEQKESEARYKESYNLQNGVRSDARSITSPISNSNQSYFDRINNPSLLKQ